MKLGSSAQNHAYEALQDFARAREHARKAIRATKGHCSLALEELRHMNLNLGEGLGELRHGSSPPARKARKQAYAWFKVAENAFAKRCVR